MFVVNDTFNEEAIMHLLSNLGLPQIAVMDLAGDLPSTVHTVIDCTGSESIKNLSDKCSIWSVKHSSTVIDTRGLEEINFSHPMGKNHNVALPTYLKYTSIANDNKIGPYEGLSTIFWLKQRLMKRTDEIPVSELIGWCCIIRLFDIKPSRSDGLLEQLLDGINKRLPKRKKNKVSCPLTCVDRNEILSNWVNSTISSKRLGGFFINGVKTILRKAPKADHLDAFTSCPEYMLWAYITGKENLRKQIINHVETNICDYNKASQIIVAKLIISLEGKRAPSILIDKIARLNTSGAVFPFVHLQSKALCFSPLVIGEYFNTDIPINAFIDQTSIEKMDWLVF